LLKEELTVKSTIENIMDTVIADENRTLSEQAEIEKAEQKLKDLKQGNREIRSPKCIKKPTVSD